MTRPQLTARIAITFTIVVFTAFWTWALFFASKESVNRIGDREWAARAQSTCEPMMAELVAMTDERVVVEMTRDELRERGDVIDAATDVIERVLDQVVAIEPDDSRGREVVPMWEDEYRTWLQDRRNYADQIRATGDNLAFYETSVGIPISERIETFAVENAMPACAPPRDLSPRDL